LKNIQRLCFNKRRHQHCWTRDSFQTVGRVLVCLIKWKWRHTAQEKRNALRENLPPLISYNITTHTERRED